MELDLPEGDDAFNIKGSIDGELWEAEIDAALERGENHFTVEIHVDWIDEAGHIHHETQEIEISANSVEEFWDQYYDDLEAIIDDLPADYEDAALTG